MNTAVRYRPQSGGWTSPEQPHGHPQRPSERRAGRAVVAAEVAAGMFVAAAALFGVAYVIGGSDATEDNWVAVCVGVVALGGALLSFGAFVVALAMKVRGATLRPMWLPLSVFPAAVAFLLLGELFWWE